MKFTKGTAIYTGGGVYICIGQTDTGLFFNGCPDFCILTDIDTRTEDEDGLICCYEDKMEGHIIADTTEEVWRAFQDFCHRLDEGEEGITEGYEEFSNYARGEVERMIDFSDWNR